MSKTSLLLAVSIIAASLLFSVPVWAGEAPEEEAPAGEISAPEGAAAGPIRKVYIPTAFNRYPIRTPVMLGVYAPGFVGDQSVVNTQFKALDAWASPGTRMSIGGAFMRFEDTAAMDYNIKTQMETLWSNGYTCFMNLETAQSSRSVANGAIDSQIRTFANSYKSWVDKGGGRFAYLAPMPEMNLEDVPWGLDPANYILAFARIQDIFRQQGVPDNAVKWVFAPNGWTRPGYPDFPAYYPGDNRVDVVAFSSYNFGYSSYAVNLGAGDWQNPDEVYGPYLAKMVQLAPNKPIFISQSATTAYAYYGVDHSKKNDWLRSAYNYLAASPNVKGILYFNLTNWQNIDWPFYVANNSTYQYQGYREAVTSPAFGYLSPADQAKKTLLP